MMMLHIEGDRQGASAVSIPRDAWVYVPGRGQAKANAAFSYGGASLAAETVEAHGPGGTYDPARDVRWTAGEHWLHGDAAVDYVGQRYGLPCGDLDRVKRQQVFLRALLARLADTDVLGNPRAILDLVDRVASHVSVDDEWSVREMGELALSLRSLRGAEVDCLTVPVAGFGSQAGQSVVLLDSSAGRRLWSAVRQDRSQTGCGTTR